DLWPAAGTGWVLILLIGLVVVWASRREGQNRKVLAVGLAVLSLIAVALTTAVVAAFAWFDVSLSDGVGERNYTPASVADVRSSYELGIGELNLDLSNAVGATRPVHAKVGIGDLRITVPKHARVSVNAKAKAGDVTVLGREDQGRNATVTLGGGNGLVVDAKIGAGDIHVVRAE